MQNNRPRSQHQNVQADRKRVQVQLLELKEIQRHVGVFGVSCYDVALTLLRQILGGDLMQAKD
jgi:hypothetical protein